jgi:hypothetical protein
MWLLKVEIQKVGKKDVDRGATEMIQFRALFASE